MKQKIRYLDKTKKCNKRCSSCKYWDVGRITAFGITETTYNFCNNKHSDEYLKHNHYWNCCDCFTWAETIIDKNNVTGENNDKK